MPYACACNLPDLCTKLYTHGFPVSYIIWQAACTLVCFEHFRTLEFLGAHYDSTWCFTFLPSFAYVDLNSNGAIPGIFEMHQTNQINVPDQTLEMFNLCYFGEAHMLCDRQLQPSLVTYVCTHVCTGSYA